MVEHVRRIQFFLIRRRIHLNNIRRANAIRNVQRFYRRTIAFERLNSCVLRMEDAVITI